MIACTSDIVVADLVHQRIARIAPNDAARSGNGRVSIPALWDALCADSDDRWFPRAPIGRRVAFGPSEIADFEAWLERIVRFTDASGRPLVVVDDGLVVDRVADPKAYSPRVRPTIILNPSALRSPGGTQ